MKYLIIGASAAGINAAKELRKLDNSAEITIISKDEKVYSRCMLHYLIAGERDVEELKFITDDFWEQYDINWINDQEVVDVQVEDNQVKLSDDSQHNYDQLLIATGSTPFLPPIDNLDQGQEVFGLRNLEDAEEIEELGTEIDKAVVIGAGLVGVDAAIGLNELGVDVSIVELGDRILPQQLDEEASARYQSRFNEAGIQTITNRSAQKLVIDEQNHVQGLKLDNGKELKTQLVIVATGVKPNTNLVADTPINIDQGIIVDEYQQTAIDNIYAAGDVCQSEEVFSDELTLTPIWPLAVKQGKIAARNMVGQKEEITENFAYQNSMRFLDLSAITYGLVNVDNDDYRVYISQDKDNYKKLILKDNQLRGAVFVGDIDNSGVYGKLIKEEINLSNKLDKLFQLSYGDFFEEEPNGQFVY
ncbi:FAD-dependent oxidoreductase [Halanaerobacter jeridensis]|uniref:NAD(P)H-nitrite reductase large subunit n=1 Tax=Halanaerobacter jeridensis TaxID=706427 RepID=A0A939BSW0_9FIRM|nr:NAD(P)H-nitrite reductase large subunit [Halanaerobacter jeridensis]